MARRFEILKPLLPALALFTLAALTPQQQTQKLAGSYSCVTHASSGQTWRFTTSNSPFGAWLSLRAEFAAQNGAPAQSARTYLGYDAASKRWNIVSMSSDGSYYTRYSVSQALNGSRWRDGYPDDGGRAVITTPSSREYVFDFTSGRSHSRTTCTRTPPPR